MIYLYDDAIVDDLKHTIDPEGNANVNMCNPESYQGILAQMQEDKITYPLFLLVRDDNMPVRTELMNFSRYMKGVATVFDPKTNNIYYEKAVPVDVRYTLFILATNAADRDEAAREIYFKYLSMYYLHIETPYEARRRIRFGIQVDKASGLQNESGSSEYLKSGTLYQSQINFLTDGCVWLNYTPRHLEIETLSKDIKIDNPKGNTNE